MTVWTFLQCIEYTAFNNPSRIKCLQILHVESFLENVLADPVQRSMRN